MNETFSKISYILQLIPAVLVFIAPIRKKPRFPLRASVGAVLLLAASFLINTWISIPEDPLPAMLYWAAFPFAMLPYVWFLADVSFPEVLAVTVFASAMQHVTCNIMIIYNLYFPPNIVLFFMVMFLFYGLFYFIFAVKLARNGRYAVNRNDLVPMVTIFLFVTVFSITQNFIDMPPEGHLIYFLCDSLCCIYILWQQVIQREKIELQCSLDGVSRLWNQQKEQYEVTQETIETINRKCHDLRHQIRAASANPQDSSYFKELEEAVEIYDTAIRTGNTALDTVLMEKGLYCRNHNIHLTSLIDGSLLSGIEPADIYAMFGNALDNAISAVLNISDESRRVISMNMQTQGGLLAIQVRNYYDGEIRFSDGLPVTTRQDRTVHGYGMKSLRYTAEKYGGMITVSAKDQVFSLGILLPV